MTSFITEPPVRILVTGSREFEDEAIIRKALIRALVHYAPNKRAVLVHGDCPYGGADEIAHRVWLDLSRENKLNLLAPERHPAKFDVLGRKAGPLRNQEMVDLGADVVLAFPLPGSKGTWDCVSKARAAGITVEVVVSEPSTPSGLVSRSSAGPRGYWGGSSPQVLSGDSVTSEQDRKTTESGV